MINAKVKTRFRRDALAQGCSIQWKLDKQNWVISRNLMVTVRRLSDGLVFRASTSEMYAFELSSKLLKAMKEATGCPMCKRAFT